MLGGSGISFYFPSPHPFLSPQVMATSKQKQFACDVVVFSNLKAYFGDSQVDDVVKGLTKMDIQLKVLVLVGHHFRRIRRIKVTHIVNWNERAIHGSLNS